MAWFDILLEAVEQVRTTRAPLLLEVPANDRFSAWL
jgi:hypothetical protein